MTAPQQQFQKNIVNDAILKEISDAIHRLAFGTVTIKINQSKIVQIEVAESKRFDNVWPLEGSGI
ncbi:MAG: YezD family protein [Candidatus Omnitrophota bacterium]